MRVAFDAICLGDGPITGVSRSFLNGLSAYAALWPDDTIVLVPEGADRRELPDVRVVEAPRGALRRQLWLPKLLRQLEATVLHSAVASVPLRAPCPTIATVHDLPWLHAESGERATWWRRFATTRSLRAATAVIAPSRFTLDAAARILGSSEKLHHIAHTTPTPTPTPTPPGEPQPRTGPFLVLGDDRSRKNRERVQAAHRLAREREPDLPDIRFVGPPGDYVDEAEKAHLLRTCRAVVACSLYEGFGMPVLEAIANGAPLVCSDIPPHREIAGPSATFVDPKDTEAIAKGILRAAPVAEAPPLGTPESQATRWRALHEAL